MVKETLKLPYGLRDSYIVHISEISEDQRGLKCNCVCPVCHEPLQARIGMKRIKHFAHSRNCPNAAETALHMMAKDIVLNNRQILLPHVEFAYEIIKPSKYFKYNHAKSEYFIKGIKPDLMISDGKNTLFIEIVVTHDVDDEKYEKIKYMNLSVLKIDLEEYYYTSILNGTYEHLENHIIHQQTNKEWINNKLLNKAIEDYENEDIREEEQAKRKVSDLMLKLYHMPNLLYPMDGRIAENKYWKHTNQYLHLDIDDIYEYLNYPIPGEIIFDCDRRIWQTTLFSLFVINNKYSFIKIEWVSNWIVKKKGLPINWLVYGSWRQNAIQGFKLPSLADVLAEFFMQLADYGFLLPDLNCEVNDNTYNWKFYIKNKMKIIEDGEGYCLLE